MKRTRTTILACGAALALSAAVAPVAQAEGEYEFIRVAQGSSPPLGCPALNNDGEVAFPTRQGIVFGTPGNTELVLTAQDLGASSLSNRVLLNDAGDIVFSTFTGAGEEIGIWRDGQVQTIAVTDNEDFSAIATSLNDLGQVSYHETLNFDYEQGLFVWDGGVTETVLLPGTGPVGAGESSVLNDAGALAVKDGPEIFTYAGGEFTQVTVPAELLVVPFGLVDFSDDGTVVLSGWRNGSNGLFAVKDGRLTTVVDTSGALDHIRRGVVNDVGGVAVSATFKNWTSDGIFDGGNPATDTVVAKGDLLFGSTVGSLNLCDINDAGQVLFTGSLTNGSGFIAVAQKP